MKKNDATYPRTISQAPEPIKTATRHSNVSLSRSPECPSLKNDADHKANDWDYWKKLDCWTLAEAIILITGDVPFFTPVDPNYSWGSLQKAQSIDDLVSRFTDYNQKTPNIPYGGLNNIEDFIKSLRLFQRGVQTGTLQCIDKCTNELERHIKPSDFITWSIDKGIPIPDELRSLASDASDNSDSNAQTKSDESLAVGNTTYMNETNDPNMEHEKQAINKGKRISGWKQIADYMKCSLGTAKNRYYRSCLPVQKMENSNEVYAWSLEINQWFSNNSHRKLSRKK